MTTTVVPTTSLRFGQVTFFISAMTLFQPSRMAVIHSRGFAMTAFSLSGSIRTPLVSFWAERGLVGRPRGARTPNLRFWRPLLYQLSYWPASAAKACKSTALTTYSPALFRLPVNRVLPIVTAELLELQLLRHRLLVLRRRIVPTFALGALERDDFSSCARHVRFLRMSVEPSTRFELVTPSLPRTCSTPELRGLTQF